MMPFQRPRLSTRIALTMALAMLLMTGLNATIFVLLPRPQNNIYSARWLVGRVDEAVREVFGAPASERSDIARRMGTKVDLDISWHEVEPPRARISRPSGLAARIQASVQSLSAGGEQSIVLDMHGGPPTGRGGQPDGHGDHRYIPRGFEQTLPTGPLIESEPDIPIHGFFRFLVKGRDGTWLQIAPPRPAFLMPFLTPQALTIAGAALVIMILSIWTARRSLLPLETLVEATTRLGVERVAAPIDTSRLGDFAAIGDAFNKMQTRIKGFVDERTQMLAAISHDLRTSLTRIRLTAEEFPDAEAKTELISNVLDMERMVSATLTFAGDDLTQERAEKIDLAALLMTISDDFTDLGAEVDYRGPDHLFLECRPVAVKRLFLNVIENAVKYGKRAVVALAIENGNILASIDDDGPGIPKDQVELALQPFKRLEQSRSRETGGVGLGLTIARDIVMSHGGSIALLNRPEGGLRALIRLPQVFAEGRLSSARQG